MWPREDAWPHHGWLGGSLALPKTDAWLCRNNAPEARGVLPTMRSRKRPVHGVYEIPGQPTIVFLTVCTEDRRPWLATSENHALLRSEWIKAQAWLVGRYIVMPDHLHLFAAPGQLGIPLDNWVTYWKSQLSKAKPDPASSWQVDHWDTRLRSGESYEAKWEYVKNNPVRAGLVRLSDEWPYQGEINHLRW
jgi:putative transposase